MFDLQGINSRVNAASKGPWIPYNDGHVGSVAERVSGGIVMPTTMANHGQKIPNAQFIAHARTDVLILLALVGSQADRIKELEDLLLGGISDVVEL